jgi:hypothetical protein
VTRRTRAGKKNKKAVVSTLHELDLILVHAFFVRASLPANFNDLIGLAIWIEELEHPFLTLPGSDVAECRRMHLDPLVCGA